MKSYEQIKIEPKETTWVPGPATYLNSDEKEPIQHSGVFKTYISK